MSGEPARGVRVEPGEVQLLDAFRAAGLKTSDKKTWQRIYVVTFTMDDLR